MLVEQEDALGLALAEKEARLRRQEEDATAAERRASSLLVDAETQANRIVSPSHLPKNLFKTNFSHTLPVPHLFKAVAHIADGMYRSVSMTNVHQVGGHYIACRKAFRLSGLLKE